MKGALLTAVGKRDPIPMGKDESGEGAIITLVGQLLPDAVLLLPTEGTPEGRSSTLHEAELTREEILRRFPDMVVRSTPLPIEDPTDYQALLLSMRTAIAGFLAASGVIKCWVNLSSGTGQQKAVWLMLASGGALPEAQLFDVVDPRFALDGANRVRPVNIEFLEEEDCRKRAVRAFETGAFIWARDELERAARATVDADRRKIYRRFGSVADVYAKWDGFAFGEAERALVALQRGWVPEGLSAVLDRQAQALREMASPPSSADGPENPRNLLDLYWNAKRAASRGEYVDVLARTRRVLEGVLYWRLRGLGIEPIDLGKSSNVEASRRLSMTRKKAPFGLWDTVDALKTLGDSVASTWIRERRTALESMNDTRNRSIDGHGLQPVTKSDSRLALELAGSALVHLAEAPADLAHAFDEGVLHEVATILGRTAS